MQAAAILVAAQLTLLLSGLEANAAASSLSRQRRVLEDNIEAEQVSPIALYIDPVRGETDLEFDSTVRNSPTFIPTTQARQWVFFELTPGNRETVTSFIDVSLERGACLASAQYMRCTSSDCVTTSRNSVPQMVYSWDPINQRFSERGPGASGPSDATDPSEVLTSYRPVIANGVRSLSHFYTEGQDFLVPASSDEDVDAANPNQVPTSQCGDVWRYKRGQGYEKYQSCQWRGQGTQHVETFTTEDGLFLLHTSMVYREYIRGTLSQESYSGQPTFLLKWSNRTTATHPFGFFLSGGELSGGTLAPGDAGYDERLGNNGANVWQVFEGLHGVVHAHHVSARGQHFLALAEHVENSRCTAADWGGSFMTGCENYEIHSTVYKLDPRAVNPRGDCNASGLPIGCQAFRGGYIRHQSLPTKGASHMHFFEIETSGQRDVFLAIAESHDNRFQPVESAVYKWYGNEFGPFQTLTGSYTSQITSMRLRGTTFLLVTNRGCPETPRPVPQLDCDNLPEVGRTRLWKFDVTRQRFHLLDEAGLGTLHAFGTVAAGAASLVGTSAWPVSAAPFALPSFDQSTLGDNVQYVAIANSRVVASDCASTNSPTCDHPANLFFIQETAEKVSWRILNPERPKAKTLSLHGTPKSLLGGGVSSLVQQVSDNSLDTQLLLEDLTNKIHGGDALAEHFVRYVQLSGRERTKTAPHSGYAWTAPRQSTLNVSLLGFSSMDSFKHGARQFLVLGFRQSRHTFDDCMLNFGPRFSPSASEDLCPHLGHAERVLATEEVCRHACDGTSFPFQHTNTVVLEIQGAPGNLTFQLHQSIPSLSVRDVHLSQDPFTSEKILAISNAESSCDFNYVTQRHQGRHPLSGVQLLRWNTSSLLFTPFNTIATRCTPSMARSFTTACQLTEGDRTPPRPCESYFAVAEDCSAEQQQAAQDNKTSTAPPYRIGFYRRQTSSQTFVACQRHDDPGSAVNQAASRCRQPRDVYREQGVAQEGDEHIFDFPDLLPRSFPLTDDFSGYRPTLRGVPAGSPIALTFLQPTAVKQVYARDAVELTQPLQDEESDGATSYAANGRKRFEWLLVVTYDAPDASPQVYGLEALYPVSPACRDRHATTPRRRAFELVQELSNSNGGHGSVPFQRLSFGGTLTTFLAVPERFALKSSVYVNRVCDEFSKISTLAFVENANLLKPPRDILGGTFPANDTEWCPYSDHPNHFEAWEAFLNHFRPVDGCGGKRHNPAWEKQGASVRQLVFNRVPPASLRNLSRLADTSYASAYFRPIPVNISTHEFYQSDYSALHAQRDFPFSLLQTMDTFNASDVAAHAVCGHQSGQLWMQFAQYSGYSERKRSFFRWNDRFAVANDGRTCTAAAARLLVADRGKSALTGCFETQPLAAKVNEAEAEAIAFLEQNGQLLSIQANAGHFAGKVPAINVSFPCNSSFGEQQRGEPVYVLGVSLQTYGGLACQSSRPDVAMVPEAAVNLEQLERHFVTRDTDQTITGTKRFAAVITDTLRVENDLDANEVLVHRDMHVEGGLAVAGLVNGIHLTASWLNAEELYQAIFRRLAALEEEHCAGEGSICAVMSPVTRCYPRPNLLPVQRDALLARFIAYLHEYYPSMEVLHAHMAPNNNTVVLVARSVSSTPLVRISSCGFFDGELCTASASALVRVPTMLGYTELQHRIGFTFAHCSTLGVEVEFLLQSAVARQLSAFGVRATDVLIQSVACDPTALTVVVSVAAVFAQGVLAALQSPELWDSVYANLVLRFPTVFSLRPRALEYAEGSFVPTNDDVGSGDGI